MTNSPRARTDVARAVVAKNAAFARTVPARAATAARPALLRLRGWALNVGRDERSLEPTLRAAAWGWWRGRSLTSPPAVAKQRHLLQVFRDRGHRVFVEAGTYRGQTTAFFVPHADRVVSVELSAELHQAARQRFADEPKVELIQGDSLVEIPRLVAECDSPPLIFLDGHFSGTGTAKGEVMEPSESTLARLGQVAPPGTTIVVDDLRFFGSGQVGFPQLDEITATARATFPDSVIRVGLDSIVIELP